jgi:hypothetical protein
MSVPVKGRPLPLPNETAGDRPTLGDEVSFWASLRCSFGPVHHQRVTTVPGGPLNLISSAVRLQLPQGAELIWARYEVWITNAPCTDAFPRLVAEASTALGPVRIGEDGRIDQTIQPDPDGDLPGFLMGWADREGIAVWDLLSSGAHRSVSIRPLLLISSDVPDGTVAGRHRLVALVKNAGSYKRLALFEDALSSEVGVELTELPEAEGLIDDALVVDSQESADQVRRQLADSGAAFVIIVSNDDVTGLVTAQELDALADEAGMSELATAPPLCFDVAAPLDDIVHALRDRLAVEPDTAGSVIIADGRPVGVVQTATALNLAGIPVRSADQLAGSPLTTLIFECEDHSEQVSISYYDPANPPRCSNGDLMRRRR